MLHTYLVGLLACIVASLLVPRRTGTQRACLVILSFAWPILIIPCLFGWANSLRQRWALRKLGARGPFKEGDTVVVAGQKYTVTREMAPLYTMGHVGPKGESHDPGTDCQCPIDFTEEPTDFTDELAPIDFTEPLPAGAQAFLERQEDIQQGPPIRGEG